MRILQAITVIVFLFCLPVFGRPPVKTAHIVEIVEMNDCSTDAEYLSRNRTPAWPDDVVLSDKRTIYREEKWIDFENKRAKIYETDLLHPKQHTLKHLIQGDRVLHDGVNVDPNIAIVGLTLSKGAAKKQIYRRSLDIFKRLEAPDITPLPDGYGIAKNRNILAIKQDYKEVNGVRFPHYFEIRRTYANNIVTNREIYETAFVEFDMPLTDEDFEFVADTWIQVIVDDNDAELKDGESREVESIDLVPGEIVSINRILKKVDSQKVLFGDVK